MPTERQDLFEVNRALFSNPDCEDIYQKFRERGIEPAYGPVAAPMAGEDLFVSETLLHIYTDGVVAFFKKIADFFGARPEQFFLRRRSG